MTSLLTQIRAAAPSARIVVLNLYNPLLANAATPAPHQYRHPNRSAPSWPPRSSDMFAQLCPWP